MNKEIKKFSCLPLLFMTMLSCGKDTGIDIKKPEEGGGDKEDPAVTGKKTSLYRYMYWEHQGNRVLLNRLVSRWKKWAGRVGPSSLSLMTE